LWAAYKLGSFVFAEEEMDADEFAIWADDFISRFDRVDTLFARTPRGVMPVGWCVSLLEGRRIVPHVFWAKWATARNKTEAALAWFHGARNERTREGVPLRAVIQTTGKDKGFFEHLKRYGVIGGGFRVPDLYEDRSDAWFFYLKGF
jgi:hypothetical protein